ncbi:MAG: Hsp70 family protein, partial [Rugosibacter sp.]
VKDAEAHAEEDKKAHEMVDARNQCDAMVHSVKKSLAEHGDKISTEEKAAIEAAIAEAETAMQGADKDAIEAKTKALTEASMKLGEKIYAESQAAGAAGGADAGAGGAGQAKADEGDVVDAEFTEVKDKK